MMQCISLRVNAVEFFSVQQRKLTNSLRTSLLQTTLVANNIFIMLKGMGEIFCCCIEASSRSRFSRKNKRFNYAE